MQVCIFNSIILYRKYEDKSEFNYWTTNFVWDIVSLICASKVSYFIYRSGTAPNFFTVAVLQKTCNILQDEEIRVCTEKMYGSGLKLS